LDGNRVADFRLTAQKAQRPLRRHAPVFDGQAPVLVARLRRVEPHGLAELFRDFRQQVLDPRVLADDGHGPLQFLPNAGVARKRHVKERVFQQSGVGRGHVGEYVRHGIDPRRQPSPVPVPVADDETERFLGELQLGSVQKAREGWCAARADPGP